MKYANLIDLIYSKPWAIVPEQHKAIQALFESYLAGNTLAQFEPEEGAERFAIVGNTAVVNVDGTILPKASALQTMCGAFSLQLFKADLRALAADPAVENIILNIASGGGVATGVPEAAQVIREVSKIKNVIAYTDSTMASAAYWIGASANRLFISSSASLGSIGVYLALLDVSKAMEKQGISLELIKAGKFKAMGLAGTSLTEEERAMLQEQVDSIYQEFTNAILAKRPNVPASAMEGQMFNSRKAIENKLADGVIDDLDELIKYLNR